jgi:hypothetical protein
MVKIRLRIGMTQLKARVIRIMEIRKAYLY